MIQELLYKIGVGLLIVFNTVTGVLPVTHNYLKSQLEGVKLESKSFTDRLGADTLKFVGGKNYFLSGSGVSATDTTVGLTGLKTPVSDYVITMNDVGDIGYGTLEPNTSRREFISFTGITQNSDGTASLTGVTRGLSVVSPYTASTTLRLAHSGGSKFIISNPPQLYNETAVKGNDESITKVWDFAPGAPPRYTSVPSNHSTGATASTTAEFASVAYVNAVTVAGTPDANENIQGSVELATGLELASSTSSGAEARLVLPASLATSTPYTGATTTIPVTQTNGKLNQTFLNLDEQFRFSAATTTMRGLEMGYLNATGTVQLNNVPYTFPSNHNASSSILMNNGAGILSWGGSGWTLLGETTNGSATTSLNLTSIPARRFLKVLVYITSLTAADHILIQFNGDDATNQYGRALPVTSGLASNATSTLGTSISLTNWPTSFTDDIFVNFDMINISSLPKYLNGQVIVGDPGSAPDILASLSGNWNNTSSTTNRIQVKVNGANSINADSYLVVFGSN